MARLRPVHLGGCGLYPVSRAARAPEHSRHGRRATACRRLVSTLQGAAELSRSHRQVGECRLPRLDAEPRHAILAASPEDHAHAPAARDSRRRREGERMTRRRRLLARVIGSLLMGLVIAGGAQTAWAQAYPAQAITFVVGFAAGGIADVVARLVGQRLSERLGQTVVVENRGGAGGNLAAKAVSAA